ncbi:extracellular solute-binding protein [Catenovulum agarivorans]|uniref:extracellular solute-binding protein n=1 Tax=Catenovulum agarivorans TaxID=1172192 RepID=UPI0003773321|nr:extracellular solute-binding protein [Catenovulum agarivorans]
MLRKVCLVVFFVFCTQVRSETIQLWRTLSAADEMRTFTQQVERFNLANPQYQVSVQAIPHGAYAESVIGGALAQDLPCILAVDQPNVANYAWSGLIQPLYTDTHSASNLISPLDFNHVNANGIGKYNGKVYSLGPFDIALALFTRRSLLNSLDFRIPTLAQPWSVDEFNMLLEKIKQQGQFKYILDMNLAGVGEWPAYGFLPMIVSAGGDFIERSTYRQAEGFLNSKGAVQWGHWLQNLLDNELTQLSNLEHGQFEKGLLAIHYTGSWMVDRYQKAIGDDLLILPPVDFGSGAYIGGGSWHYTVTRNCPQPKQAAKFIAYLMTNNEIAFFNRGSGFIPTSAEAANQLALYSEQGALRKLYLTSERNVVLRPATPAYPAISAIFSQAVRRIAQGADVTESLDRAVDEIELNILDNRGYR